MIQWLTRRFSRDPGQLGLFEPGAPAATATATATSVRVAIADVIGTSQVPAARAESERCEVEEPAVAVPTVTSRHDSDGFLVVLRRRGLRGVDRVVLTRNRRTMVSLAGGVLRVHESFVHAPAAVHEAIAVFATSRNRAHRAVARGVIVSHPVPIRPATRRPAVQHADDLPMATRLTTLHAQLNLTHFAGVLAPLEIRVSRRLARRLGHYTPRTHTGGVGEIVMSRRHVRRDGWTEALHTLLHELVHQWQDETGEPVDHGAGFRAKCRAVGIAPAATRMLAR